MGRVPVIYGLVILVVIASSVQAMADSVLGEVLDELCDNCSLGEAFEDAQRQMTQAMMTYRELDNMLFKGVERLTRDGIVASAAPLVCASIRESRDKARRAGTRP